MMLRAFTFSILCGAVFFGISLGDAQAARKAKGAPRCMEAVVPKCTPPQFLFCAKKSKCGLGATAPIQSAASRRLAQRVEMPNGRAGACPPARSWTIAC